MPREYEPRPCVNCGKEARYAVSALVRTLGAGPGKRKMKTGPTRILCEECMSIEQVCAEIVGPITVQAYLYGCGPLAGKV